MGDRIGRVNEKMTFNNEDLIVSVYVRNALWDQKNKNYHNRLIIDKNWEEISKELNETIDVLKKKWKQLRDTFRNELKKISVERSGDAGPNDFDEKNSSWPHFKAMSFLKDQMKCRASTGKLKKIKIEENNTICSSLPEEKDLFVGSFEEDFSMDVPLKNSPLRVKNANQNAELINNEKIELGLLEHKTNLRNERCEDTAFFESLLPHVKKLDPAHKMLLRIEMQKLVYNHVYSSISTDSST